MDKQIIEINEQIKKAIQRIENIGEKYDELREKYKAKEQECEELKEQLTMLDDEAVVVEITVEQFEEYKKLKAELEVEKNWHKTADEISKANSEYTAKLKQALKEIKEIVYLELAYGTNEEYANFYMQQREAILLKISECEVNNEV